MKQDVINCHQDVAVVTFWCQHMKFGCSCFAASFMLILQSCIQNHVKRLKWSFWGKNLNTFFLFLSISLEKILPEFQKLQDLAKLIWGNIGEIITSNTIRVKTNLCKKDHGALKIMSY